MKELIQRLEDLELLTTDDQLYKADEIWDRLLELILELKKHDYSSTDVLQRLQSIELEDIIAKYLEYNRPSLQIKVMEFTTVFLRMVYSDDQFKISQRLSNQIAQLMQSPNRQVKMMAINTCTELYKYKRWSEECKIDIKPMVEIIVHESDQQVLTLAIDLFSTICMILTMEILASNLQTMYRNIHRHDPVKAVECGIIPALVNTLSSIRTELDQGGIFENLMAIVQSDTADHRDKRVADQIIETCFQHRVHVASPDIQPYDDNAEIDMKSGMAGYTHGNARTLVEMQYIQYLQSILCKPMWWIDITNQHIVEQWRADSLDQNISPSTFNLALEQLGVFVKQLVCSGSDGLGTIVPGPVELTYILDNGIPDNVYTRLMTNVSDIEHGSNHNTGQMVHNLIDASMYSVVYGQTMIAPLSIRLEYTTMVPCDILLSTRLVSDMPIIEGNPEFISRKFQCLPSEFRVEQDGSVTINSYINNLNPIWHRDMYKCIAKIFKCFVPMFESLFRTMDPMFKYIDIHNGTKGYEPPNQSSRGGMESDTQVTRPVYVPTLRNILNPNESAKPVSLRGRNLQVIVKLTNIQLTPSKPKYDEGNWHIEGPINESIVATGLYYYDVENITTPKLDYREAVDRLMSKSI
ncbi:hypothetical protein O5D80_002250 [Batrachochytrium dendrobatidis]|nr:hypothetical protein O5D80_002250 [Batrachochytrium dendrobatidis]